MGETAAAADPKTFLYLHRLYGTLHARLWSGVCVDVEREGGYVYGHRVAQKAPPRESLSKISKQKAAALTLNDKVRSGRLLFRNFTPRKTFGSPAHTHTELEGACVCVFRRTNS